MVLQPATEKCNRTHASTDRFAKIHWSDIIIASNMNQNFKQLTMYVHLVAIN